MNLDKRENVQFVAGENLARHLKSPKFKRMEIYDSAFEVVKKKGRITDQIAIHIGLYFFGFQIFIFFSSIHDFVKRKTPNVAFHARYARMLEL